MKDDNLRLSLLKQLIEGENKKREILERIANTLEAIRRNIGK